MNDSECQTEGNRNPSQDLDDTILKILESSSQTSSSKSNNMKGGFLENDFVLKKKIYFYEDNNQNYELLLKQPEQKPYFGKLQNRELPSQFRSNANNLTSSYFNNSEGEVCKLPPYLNHNCNHTSPLYNHTYQKYGETLTQQNFHCSSQYFKNQDSYAWGSASTKFTDFPTSSSQKVAESSNLGVSSNFRINRKAGTHIVTPVYNNSSIGQQSYMMPLYQSSHQFYSQNLPHTYSIPLISNLNVASNMVNNMQLTPKIMSSDSSNLRKARIQKNYENMSIEELASYVPFLSQEQSGCRFLQNKIELIPNFAEVVVLPSLYPNLIEYSINQFGNYLVQKLIDYVSSEAIINIMNIVSSLISLD